VRHERISWAFCTGRFEDKLILSLRSTNPNAKAGQLIRKLVKNDYLAGGHGMTGGGYVPIEEDEECDESLEDRFTARFLKLMGHNQADWKPLLDGEATAANSARKKPNKTAR
jgi:hypothetical protein